MMKKVTLVESLFIFLFYYKYIYTYIHIRTLVFSKHPMMKKADGLRPTLVVSIGRDTDKNLVYWSFCSTLKKLKKNFDNLYIFFQIYLFVPLIYLVLFYHNAESRAGNSGSIQDFRTLPTRHEKSVAWKYRSEHKNFVFWVIGTWYELYK